MPRSLLLVLVPCVSLAVACNGTRFLAPNNPIEDSGLRAAFEEQMSAGRAKSLVASYYGCGDEARRCAIRNEIIAGIVLLIDNEFEYFATRTLSTRAFTNTTLDGTAAGLGLAATVVQHSQTSAVLSAIGAGVLGIKLSIDKEFFFEQSTPILVAQMNKDRQTSFEAMRNKLRSSSVEYPLAAAVRDLGSYYEAGTLTHAFAEVLHRVSESGAAATGDVPRLTVEQKAEDPQKILVRFTNKDLVGRNVNVTVVGYTKENGDAKDVVVRHSFAPLVGADGEAVVDVDFVALQGAAEKAVVKQAVLTAPTSSQLVYVWP